MFSCEAFLHFQLVPHPLAMQLRPMFFQGLLALRELINQDLSADVDVLIYYPLACLPLQCWQLLFTGHDHDMPLGSGRIIRVN
jgi:hypothetical protein